MSQDCDDRSPSRSTSTSSPKMEWHRVLLGARSRILAWYVLLMALSASISLLMIRQELIVRLDRRTERTLAQEIQEYQRIVTGRNPETGEPFGDDVTAILDIYLSRNIPDDNEFFITFINGQLYRSKPSPLPPSLQPESSTLQYWSRISQAGGGQKKTAVGGYRYAVEPIVRGQTQAILVVVRSIADDRKIVDEAIWVFIEVTTIVLAVASVLAWVAAGRVLSPVRLLTETARSITESDLTRRIPIRGDDEIAELALTFNEMLDRLQSAFASQRNFINDASHELQTPITIVRGHLELMGNDPEEQRETLDLVIDELDRMSRLVSDLLLLAKAEQPNFLHLQTLEMGAFMEEIFAKVKALALRDWQLDHSESGVIVGDRQRLTQAIMNLAQNATQFTQAQDTIALGASCRNGYARFWVRDTGPGIALEDQQRIFDRFARAQEGRRVEGIGLGLAIVRTIAQAHGGWVDLSSIPGQGSTFTVILPVEPRQDRRKGA